MPTATDITWDLKRKYYCLQDGFMGKLDELFLELTDYADPKEATNYYVRYPGFQKVFRAPLIQPTDSLKILSSPDCLGFVERKDGVGLVNLWGTRCVRD